jgi:hypothetical protein
MGVIRIVEENNKGDENMYRKNAAELIVDGITAGTKIVVGLVEIASEVDQTLEQRKRTKEMEKQTEIMREETKLKKAKLKIEMEEEKKRTAILREKRLAEMTPEERNQFLINEKLDRINIRLRA